MFSNIVTLFRVHCCGNRPHRHCQYMLITLVRPITVRRYLMKRQNMVNYFVSIGKQKSTRIVRWAIATFWGENLYLILWKQIISMIRFCNSCWSSVCISVSANIYLWVLVGRHMCMFCWSRGKWKITQFHRIHIFGRLRFLLQHHSISQWIAWIGGCGDSIKWKRKQLRRRDEIGTPKSSKSHLLLGNIWKFYS